MKDGECQLPGFGPNIVGLSRKERVRRTLPMPPIVCGVFADLMSGKDAGERIFRQDIYVDTKGSLREASSCPAYQPRWHRAGYATVIAQAVLKAGRLSDGGQDTSLATIRAELKADVAQVGQQLGHTTGYCAALNHYVGQRMLLAWARAARQGTLATDLGRWAPSGCGAATTGVWTLPLAMRPTQIYSSTSRLH